MAGTREPLSMPSFDDMDDFAPRAGIHTPQPQAPSTSGPKAAAGQGGAQQPVPPAAEARRAIDAVSQFPSREASTDGQLNLKGPRHVLDRFRKLCKDDRRAYYDMLEILMNRYEDTSSR